MHGRRMPQAVRAAGLPGVTAGLMLAGTFFLFIGALTHTTVANTFVLMSVSPLLAAVAGWFVLGERVPLRTWMALAVAAIGIAVMFGAGMNSGRLAGNLMALGVSVCFAAQLMVLRKFHATVDMLPQVMIAGLWTLVPAFLLAGPFAATFADLGVLAFMGCVQLGAGCLLATAASRTLSATELGLLALLEPILGPIWVWVILGEHPGREALAGGAIVLGAVIANELLAVWRGRARPSGTTTPGRLSGPHSHACRCRMALPDFSPAFYAVAVVAILITGIAKGGFGHGAGGLSVPLMAMFIAPQEAAGIMLPILCAMDLFSVHAYRRAWSREHVKIMLPGAIVGIALGGLAFGLLPVNAIRLLLGLIAVTFALNQWLALHRAAGGAFRRRARPAGSRRGGVLGRRFRLHEHAGPRRRTAVRDLHAGPEGRQDAIRRYVRRVLPAGQLPQARPLLLPRATEPGQPHRRVDIRSSGTDRRVAGVAIHRRMSARVFFNLSYGLLLVTGLKLIVDAFTH